MSGRKRHILVDTMGLLLKVKVHSAGIQDRDGAKMLVALARLKLERLVIVWADQAYRGDLAQWLWKQVGCLLEIVERNKDEAGHTSWELGLRASAKEVGSGAYFCLVQPLQEVEQGLRVLASLFGEHDLPGFFPSLTPSFMSFWFIYRFLDTVSE